MAWTTSWTAIILSNRQRLETKPAYSRPIKEGRTSFKCLARILEIILKQTLQREIGLKLETLLGQSILEIRIIEALPQ